MKMWSMNVIILLLFCYAFLSTGNGRVYFVSMNFSNVLHWDPVEPASPGEKVLYSVMYWNDTTPHFRIKEGCRNITATTCDLTAETPSVPGIYYQARVSVNGLFIGRTTRFKPIADTILGPPILSVHTTVSSLYVNVTLPLGPNGVSVADIIRRSKSRPPKAAVIYTLKITEPKWAAQGNDTTTGRFVINLKNKLGQSTKYCGHVVYKPSSEWGRNESQKAIFCFMLQGDPARSFPWIFTGAALLVAMMTIAVVWMSNYVKGGKQNKMPQSLLPTSGTVRKALTSPDSRIIISTPVICTSSDQTVYATIQVKPNVPSVPSGGYSPQDIPCQAWQGSTGSSVGAGAHSPAPTPWDTSAQSSESYGAVVINVPAKESGDFQLANTQDRGTTKPPLSSGGEPWDKGRMSPKLISRGAPPLPAQDAYESKPVGALLLHVVRDTNGQLVLPLLTRQLQSNTDDTASPLNPERKPLLSDLIDSTKEGPSLASLQSFDSSEWSDSGCDDSTVNTPTQLYCNTHYAPSQPVVPDFHQQCKNTPSSDATFESGYKQNWMPAVPLGAAFKDSCEYRRTNYPCTWACPRQEEDGEGDEDRGGEERPNQILLGSWMVQIQE